MADDRANDAERDRDHDDQRLPVALERDREQNVNQNQRELEAGEESANAFALVGLPSMMTDAPLLN
jgi:hypothetical protein